jgi:hypothetical protein
MIEEEYQVTQERSRRKAQKENNNVKQRNENEENYEIQRSNKETTEGMRSTEHEDVIKTITAGTGGGELVKETRVTTMAVNGQTEGNRPQAINGTNNSNNENRQNIEKIPTITKQT